MIQYFDLCVAFFPADAIILPLVFGCHGEHSLANSPTQSRSLLAACLALVAAMSLLTAERRASAEESRLRMFKATPSARKVSNQASHHKISKYDVIGVAVLWNEKAKHQHSHGKSTHRVAMHIAKKNKSQSAFGAAWS